MKNKAYIIMIVGDLDSREPVVYDYGAAELELDPAEQHDPDCNLTGAMLAAKQAFGSPRAIAVDNMITNTPVLALVVKALRRLL